ncbi:MAG: hypothetical protein KatS3mg085_034 [Candidatus Dojkabacteria bacterium]|nr:MAG: hypothetical protein KatS3mg085_034 [Candidatus Dojkabacteria bacterium]
MVSYDNDYSFIIISKMTNTKKIFMNILLITFISIIVGTLAFIVIENYGVKKEYSAINLEIIKDFQVQDESLVIVYNFNNLREIDSLNESQNFRAVKLNVHENTLNYIICDENQCAGYKYDGNTQLKDKLFVTQLIDSEEYLNAYEWLPDDTLIYLNQLSLVRISKEKEQVLYEWSSNPISVTGFSCNYLIVKGDDIFFCRGLILGADITTIHGKLMKYNLSTGEVTEAISTDKIVTAIFENKNSDIFVLLERNYITYSLARYEDGTIKEERIVNDGGGFSYVENNNGVLDFQDAFTGETVFQVDLNNWL